MKQINKATFLKYKKELQELYKLGKKYDKEKDPEKKAILEEEVIRRSKELKGKLNLKDCSDEEAQNLLGVPVTSSGNTETDSVANGDTSKA